MPRTLVGVIVRNQNDQIVIGERRKSGEKPCKQLVGGGEEPQDGGNPLRTATREVFEESGLVVHAHTVICVIPEANEKGDICIGVLADHIAGDLRDESVEDGKWEWVDIDHIPSSNRMFPLSQRVIEAWMESRS